MWFTCSRQCRLFPADLFEAFIDIGHYKPELSAYLSASSPLLPDHKVIYNVIID